MEESNEEHRVIPELYFLIAKFLCGGPLKETAKTLLKELERVEVLPRRLDWEGNEHAQSFDELESQYSEVSWRRLATVCDRALQLATGAPTSDHPAGDSSERLAARLSLLSESLVRPRPQYATHKRDHTLARRLAARERGATAGVLAVFPARLLSGLTLQRRTLGHLSAVYCVVFTWCGRYVVTGADDMLVKVWSAVDGRLITTLRGARAEITDVCVTRDGALVACGSVDRCVRVWALADGAPRGVLAAHAGTITSVHWAPGARADVRWLASTSTDCSVAFWTCSGEGRFLSQPVQYVERMRPGVCHMICAAWSAGGAFLAAGSADHHVRVYSLAGGTPKRVLETAIHTDAVDSLAWAHAGLRLVSGSKDGAAALWTLHATQWRHVLLRPEPLQADNKRLKMTMVCWDRSDAWLLTAVSDRSVRVWCARSARQVRVLLGHRDEAYVLEPHPFLPAVFLSAGHDGQLFVWDATRSEPIARYHNRIEGHGHGAIFDAKWGAGAQLAATDSHGHLLLLGLGRGHKLFGQLPTELFFHTDYRPLVVDVSGHAHDEQTDTPPHLLPPPFLVDVEGAPHPPHYQRLVPGREHLALDQLIPAPTHHHQVGEGGEGGARGVWRGEGVRHTAGAWQRGDPLLLPPPSRLVPPLAPPAADHAHHVARELHALEEAWYRREMRRRPLMISTAGGEGGAGPRRRAGRKRRGPGPAVAPAPGPAPCPSPAPLSPLSERNDSSEEHDSSLELSDTTSTSSHTGSRSDSSMSSQYSDWEAGAALAPPARARARRTTQPARYSPSPVQKRPVRAVAPRSCPSPDASPPRATPSPPPPPPPELPEVYRPGDWITATTPKKSPYHPQMGDECLYFRLGHQRYFEAVSEKDVYKVNPRDKPWERTHVYECELVKVVGIKYVIKPPRIVCLRLACTLGGAGTAGTGRQLTVRYHDMPDVIDFLVPRALYELSVARRWGAGDRFRCIIDDSWWTGLVLDNLAPEPPPPMEQLAEPARWAAAAAAQFLALRVRWDNGEVERLSAWDLEPVDPARPPAEPGGAVPVLARELAALLQRAAPHDWPHDACAAVARHVGTVMSLAAAEPFAAPVDLARYPQYARVVPYPVDLATMRARCEARFYRRSAAAQFDARYLATNAERFNEPHSIIVRQARLVSELLLHIISNWRSVDVVSKYHELAAAYRSSDDEPLVASLKVSPDRSWSGACAGVLRELLASADAEPFRQPVQPELAPDYSLVVSSPMDLGTVSSRLSSGRYGDAAQFAADVRRVFTNSRLYNTNKRSRIYSMTVRLSALFESLWSRAGRRRSARRGLRRTRRTRTRALHALTNGSSKLDSASSDSETLAVTSRRVHGVPRAHSTERDARTHQRDSWDSDEPLNVHSKGKGVGKKSKSSSASVEPGPSTSRARSRDHDLYVPPLELRNGLGSSSSESGGELLVVEEQLPDDEVELTYDTDEMHSSGQSMNRRARRKRRVSSGSSRARGRHKHTKRTRERFTAGTSSSSSSSSSVSGSASVPNVHYESDHSYRPGYSTDDDAPLTHLQQRTGPTPHRRKSGGVSLRARRAERRYNEDSEEDSAAAISKRTHSHLHRHVRPHPHPHHPHHPHRSLEHHHHHRRQHAHLSASGAPTLRTPPTRSDHDYVAPAPAPATLSANGEVASGSRGSVGNGVGNDVGGSGGVGVGVVSVSSRGRVRKLTAKARGLLRD